MQTFSVINLHNNINNKNKNNNNKNNDNINKNNSNMYGKSLLTGSKSNFLKNSNTININNNNNNNNNQNINNNNLKDSINNIYIGSTNSSNNFSGSNSLSNTFSNSVVCTGMVSDAQSPKKMLGICGDPGMCFYLFTALLLFVFSFLLFSVCFISIFEIKAIFDI